MNPIRLVSGAVTLPAHAAAAVIGTSVGIATTGVRTTARVVGRAIEQLSGSKPAPAAPWPADRRADELAELPGVSPSRTHQIVPGALVAEACMDIFDLTELEICPWALREGVILERLDQISVITRVR